MDGPCDHTSRMSDQTKINREVSEESPETGSEGSAVGSAGPGEELRAGHHDRGGPAGNPASWTGEEPASGPEEEPASGPEKEPGSGPEGENAPKGQSLRPTPARVVMEGSVDDGGGVGDGQRTFRDPSNGLEWLVTVAGRSTSGVLPLRSIRLMEVSFALADDPELPLRMTLCQQEDLSGLSDEEILGLFRMSRSCSHSDSRTHGAQSGEGRGRGRRGRQG